MKNKQSRISWIGGVALGLAVLLCAGLLAAVGIVRGEESSQTGKAAITQYTVSFTQGRTGITDLFEDTSKTLAVDASGCITLPATFSDTVTLNDIPENRRLDCETFYFDAYEEAAVAKGILWAYTFTGWQIVNTDQRLAGETVLQPGFVIPPEVLEMYASDGTLELKALWGKCYFIQSPYANMADAYELITRFYPVSTTTDGVTTYSWKETAQFIAVNTNKAGLIPTGAYDRKMAPVDSGGPDGGIELPDDMWGDEGGTVTPASEPAATVEVWNKGNDPHNPVATVDYLYSLLGRTGDPYDACDIAMVLTGDLDYIKGVDSQYTFEAALAEQAAAATGETHTAPGTAETGWVDGDGYFYRCDATRLFGENNAASALTIKSLQETDGSCYTFYIKHLDTAATLKSSLRIDNVKLDVRNDINPDTNKDISQFLGKPLGNIMMLQETERPGWNVGDGEQFFETTARVQYRSNLPGNAYFPFAALRVFTCERTVLCGGYFSILNLYWDRGGITEGRDYHWYIGGKAHAVNAYLGYGATNTEEVVNANLYVTMTGGLVETMHGGTVSGNTAHKGDQGDRTYRIYGDGNNRSLELWVLYGGSRTAKLYGNVDILIKGCDKIGDVHGGGRDYTATVYGDINIRMEDSKTVGIMDGNSVAAKGTIYGGGLYGCCEDDPNTAEKEGNVTLSLWGCTVSDTIYGSGRGNSSTTESMEGPVGVTRKPANWDTPPKDFPVVNKDLSVTTAVYKQLAYESGKQNKADGVMWRTHTQNQFFSMASVNSTDITIHDSVVNTVYGGGAIAVVKGDTHIQVTGNSHVKGTIYGGGDGTENVKGITLYEPITDPEQFDAPYPLVDGENADIDGNGGRYQALKVYNETTGQWEEKANANKSRVMGLNPQTYSWSNDLGKFSGTPGEDGFDGINEEEKLVYTPYDASTAGQVLGSTHISVSDTATVTGPVYGGGKAGDVLGSTTVRVLGSPTLDGRIYGGGYSGAVAENATVEIRDNATLGTNVYGGGEKGDVQGSTAMIISGSPTLNGGYLFGGGYEGSVGQDSSVTITGGTIKGEVFGGCSHGRVGGNSLVEMTGPGADDHLKFHGVTVYGGGQEGSVAGTSRVQLTHVTFPDITQSSTAYLFGGGYQGDVGAVEMTLQDVKIPRPEAYYQGAEVHNGAVYGGGNKGDVLGGVTVEMTDVLLDAQFYGGGNEGKVGTGGITVTAISMDQATGSASNLVLGDGTETEKPEYTFYGGGRGAKATVAGTVNIAITDGEFDWICGGGNEGDVGDITLSMHSGATRKAASDSTDGETYYQPYVGWCLRGGGNFGGAKAITLTVNGGTVRRDTHAGGSSGSADSTHVCINGGVFTGNIYGGGDSGYVRGLCYVEINDLTMDGYSVYGGGDRPQSRVGQTHVVIQDSDLDFSGSNNYIYGGSYRGWVCSGTVSQAMKETSTNVYTVEAADPVEFTGNGSTLVEIYAGRARQVFGGSNGGQSGTFGEPAGESAFGNIMGDSQVIIHGGEITHDVYGGSNAGGTISGEASITISGGDVSNAFGGCKSGGTVMKGTKLQVTGGTVKNAYGGSNAGGTIYGTLETTLSGGRVTGKVYGGGNEADILEGTADEVRVIVKGDADASQYQGSNVWVFGGGNLADCMAPIYVEVSENAKVDYLFGGGDAATCKTVDTHINGGRVTAAWGAGNAESSLVKEDAAVTIDGGTVDSCVWGGGNLGDVDGDTSVALKSGSVGTQINGGGNMGAVGKEGAGEGGNTWVYISGGTVPTVYGGGDSSDGKPAAVYGSTYVEVSGGSVTTVYGGGNKKWATVEKDTEVTITGEAEVSESVYGGGNAGAVGGNSYLAISGNAVCKHVYGGGYQGQVLGNAATDISGGTVKGEVCGGGYEALVGSTTVRISGTAKLLGQDDNRVYGGGRGGDVAGDVTVSVSGGTVTPNLYGGGREGHVNGQTEVTVDGGVLSGNVYGGGREGTVSKTLVQILDEANIAGSVFGGGEGVTATVKGGTNVRVNMYYDFEVNEVPIDTNHITPSGQVHSNLVATSLPEHGYIGGSIYGGGDLARVGDGNITAGGDKASITSLGSAIVTVENGKIAGSVFGGGRGIPRSGSYSFYMGAVFGYTEVTVNGGLIGGSGAGGSVYGGGEQSRVYTVAGQGRACTVSIVETAGKKIAINGSVFGGGDRGENSTANASVPTVYGDVFVLIQGIEDQKPSNIYFLAGLDGESTGGGVYGDGNLCLVEGRREIKLLNFEPASGEGGAVKTFYSLQRADKATLENSAVVLLGAPDLVEEDDTGVYSINRIGHLSLERGSVVKLDQVVKYLGSISSDVHGDQKFIHDGNNGRTGTYTQTTCQCKEPLNTENHSCGCLEPLTQARIEDYRNETGNHNSQDKNVVCVANGLYLEILDETGAYGPVTGLFTLQLLYANPGEGGGFVYGSIPKSTGDFICETMNWSFTPVNAENVDTQEEYDNLIAHDGGLFIRVAGKAFQRPENFAPGQTYYTRTETGAYMEIIDDVGGKLANDEGYTYYYWYIGGPSVTYEVELTGYIGAAATEFVSNTTLPQHDGLQRSYVLYSVSVNNLLAQAVGDGGDFTLVQSQNVSDQQIAIELRLGNQSLGFLKQEDGIWGIQDPDGTFLQGYGGNVEEEVVRSQILYTDEVDGSNDRMTWVLHKAPTVTTTTADLEVYVDIDLFEANEHDELENVHSGTSMLSYTTGIRIVRLTANQSLYHENLRSYTGVATHSNIHITGNSCFSAEYQTRYVPAAYPKADGSTMVWALTWSTDTYFMSEDGAYFTVDSNGQKYNFSEGLPTEGWEALSDGSYKLGDRIFSKEDSISGEPIPKDTKITMVDLSGDTPTYYYYICAEETTYIPLTAFKRMGGHTAISDLPEADKPAFMVAYEKQSLALQTERLLFVFDFEQAHKTAESFTGDVHLAHLYQGVDILDYAKQNAAGNHLRSFPEIIGYQFHGGKSGVVDSTYTAVFESDSYGEKESAVLNVHVQEDENWINTLFRENGFALKIQLLDAAGNPISMPAGMYFTYKDQSYYPGPDSTYIAVPVHEFGDHEIILHNPRFSLISAVGGDTAKFRVSYFSAPDALYYNAFYTGVIREPSYTLSANAVSSLQVVGGPTEDRILDPGESLEFAYTARNGEKVSVTVSQKTEGQYVQVAWDSVFDGAPQSLNPAEALECSWELQDSVAPGTYRLTFTFGQCTEYLNLIVK